MAKTNATLIWNIAELLRGPFQPNQYGNVILPFTILRRLDCILEPTKDQVIAAHARSHISKDDVRYLCRLVRHRFGRGSGGSPRQVFTINCAQSVLTRHRWQLVAGLPIAL